MSDIIKNKDKIEVYINGVRKGMFNSTGLTVDERFFAKGPSPGILPIGAVVAIFPHLVGAYNCVATEQHDDNGFVLCNGQILNDPESPMNGANIPNINDSVFLMGSLVSGDVGGSNESLEHTHSVTSNVSLSAHTLSTNVGISAHTLSTNVAISGHTLSTNVAISAHSITQPAFSMPAHYHAEGTLNISSSGSHAHTIYVTGSSYLVTSGGGAQGRMIASTTAVPIATESSSHTHPNSSFSGYVGNTSGSNGDTATTCTRTTNVSVSNHTITQPVVANHSVTQPVVANHSITQPVVANHTVTNGTVSTGAALATTDNRPKYITCVYVMRVV